MRTKLFEGTANLGQVFTEGVELEVHQCGTCGVIFGAERSFMADRREDHEGWQCPNGHSFVFSGPSETEKLRKRAEQAEQRARARADLLKHEERSHAATRGHLTRHRKRAAAGVCPCCKRTLKDLARHMASKHPGYVAEHG